MCAFTISVTVWDPSNDQYQMDTHGGIMPLGDRHVLEK